MWPANRTRPSVFPEVTGFATAVLRQTRATPVLTAESACFRHGESLVCLARLPASPQVRPDSRPSAGVRHVPSRTASASPPAALSPPPSGQITARETPAFGSQCTSHAPGVYPPPIPCWSGAVTRGLYRGRGPRYPPGDTAVQVAGVHRRRRRARSHSVGYKTVTSPAVDSLCMLAPATSTTWR